MFPLQTLACHRSRARVWHSSDFPHQQWCMQPFDLKLKKEVYITDRSVSISLLRLHSCWDRGVRILRERSRAFPMPRQRGARANPLYFHAKKENAWTALHWQGISTPKHTGKFANLFRKSVVSLFEHQLACTHLWKQICHSQSLTVVGHFKDTTPRERSWHAWHSKYSFRRIRPCLEYSLCAAPSCRL